MKKSWKYFLSALLVVLFASCIFCGCEVKTVLSGSSGSTNGGSGSGGQNEQTGPKAEFSSGSGTASDPYVISQAYQWTNVGNHLSSCFELSADLNLGDIQNLKPIGNSTAPFTGTFDGKNHKIHSAVISASKNCGLFGVISGGTVKNLKFSDSRVTTTENPSDGLGGIAGQIKMGALVENCHTENISESAYLHTYAGGIIGIVSSASKVRYCSTKASIKTVSNMNYIGGLFGKMEGGSVDACWGVVSASFSSGVWHESGGIVSEFIGGKITNVYAEVTFGQLDGGIAHTSEGGSCTEFGLCFNGASSKSVPLYYEKAVAVKDTTSHYYNSTTIETANALLDTSEWSDNPLWKKGKLHPELVSYEEYLAVAGEAE